MKSSWLEIPTNSDFSISNFPFGVFSAKNNGSHSDNRRCCASRLGDKVIDLSVLEEAGLFQDIPGLDCNVFCQSTLNAFIEHPKPVWSAVRQRLISLFVLHDDDDDHNSSADSTLRNNIDMQLAALYDIDAVTLHLPIAVTDFTDFYASRDHATNVGTMFRGKDHALHDNWLHLPVGYHGRASTISLSGQPVKRPCGQLEQVNADADRNPFDTTKITSIYGPCKLLDFELEVGAVIGGPSNAIGDALTTQQARDRIFGYLIVNDWSARDIQKWEYVPLGPFTSKNFCTTVSPWIVTSDALEPFAAPTSAGRQRGPVPLPYLKDHSHSTYDIRLTVAIQPNDSTTATTICKSNFCNLYWSPTQMLVHHSVTGCVMRAGDLLGSGTLSGATPDSRGCLLELTWRGTKPLTLENGETRTFLQDGDTVVMQGWCDGREGYGRVGFGECKGQVLPATPIRETAILSNVISPDNVAEEIPSPRYSNMKLYNYWESSCSWRVRVALAAKKLDYEMIPINLVENEHKSPEFLLMSPLAQVPLLQITDNANGGTTIRISQSLAIIEFLERAFPQTRSLIPKDAYERARAMEMVELVNSGIQPLQNLYFYRSFETDGSGGKGNEYAKGAIKKGLTTLNALVAQMKLERKGPFCLGTFSPSIVDVYMVPQLYNARVRFGMDIESAFPLLAEIDKLCSTHPWFLASHPGAQPDNPNTAAN